MKPTRATALITSVSNGMGATTSQMMFGRSGRVALVAHDGIAFVTVASDLAAREGETAIFSGDFTPQATQAARPTTQLMIRTGARRQAESED